MEQQRPLAMTIAIKAHSDQKYGEHPYIVHLIEVDALVVKMYGKVKSLSEPYSKEPGDEMDKLRAVAFLHDVLEDTNVTSTQLIDAGICIDVVKAVEAMSKIEGGSYQVYIEEVKANELALKVKMCDTLANLSNSIKEGNWKRINKYNKQIQLLGGF